MSVRRQRTIISATDRLKIMFSAGNSEATTNGNGSGTRGLYQAWDLGWVELIGDLGKPTRWRITSIGYKALQSARETA